MRSDFSLNIHVLSFKLLGEKNIFAFEIHDREKCRQRKLYIYNVSLNFEFIGFSQNV